MQRQPGDDRCEWDAVLSHRPPDQRELVGDRLRDGGVTCEQVCAVLEDGGDALHAAATSGRPDWADGFGGALAVALLAAEVSALAAQVNSRSAAVRALAVDGLLDDVSAVTVAARLGVSRQKVYDISRGSHAGPYIAHVPWRHCDGHH